MSVGSGVSKCWFDGHTTYICGDGVLCGVQPDEQQSESEAETEDNAPPMSSLLLHPAETTASQGRSKNNNDVE